jgi:hypothetical protein
MLNSLFLHRGHWQWRKVVLNSLLLKLTAVLPPELLSGRTLRLAELNSLLLQLPLSPHILRHRAHIQQRFVLLNSLRHVQR